MMLLTTEQPDKATSTNKEHSSQPAYTHQPFTAYPSPFFAYSPPHFNENSQNWVPSPAPYISFPPLGMVYAFPPPQGQVLLGGPVSAPPALTKPKRRQVKMACTNCAEACKRCDESRPCERCQKYGIGDSCRDGERKERKKGIKRGPYKRHKKNDNIKAQSSSPEGYYGRIFYQNPGTFLPVLPVPSHETPLGQEGSNGQLPTVPYFLPTCTSPPYPAPITCVQHPGHEIPSGQKGFKGQPPIARAATANALPVPQFSLPEGDTFVLHPGHEIPSWQKGSKQQPPIAQAAAANALPILQFLSPEGGTFVSHQGHEIPSGQEESNGEPPIMPYVLPIHLPYYPPYEYPLCSGMPLGAQASPA